LNFENPKKKYLNCSHHTHTHTKMVCEVMHMLISSIEPFPNAHCLKHHIVYNRCMQLLSIKKLNTQFLKGHLPCDMMFKNHAPRVLFEKLGIYI
jgi:hypothetical protein